MDGVDRALLVMMGALALAAVIVTASAVVTARAVQVASPPSPPPDARPWVGPPTSRNLECLAALNAWSPDAVYSEWYGDGGIACWSERQRAALRRLPEAE